MAEHKPTKGVLDTDYIVPPTAEFLRDENEKLKAALETHDYATFSLWLQKHEQELQDDVVGHAQLLARAATILDAARNDYGATKLLLRAATLVRGKDSKTEMRIVELLQLFGGDAAVAEHSTSSLSEATSDQKVELEFVNQEYSRVTDELVALDAHDWKSKTGLLFTDEEREEHLKKLRAELQELVYRRNELRDALGLNVSSKK